MFTVGHQNGYLPAKRPLKQLPQAYAALESLMEVLPRLLADDDKGAVKTAVEGLPTYEEVQAERDPVVCQALMRDFSILVSAYLLEGKTKDGSPRDRVPRNIAVPFSIVAGLVDEPPIMSYDSYCLSNCYNVNEGDGPDRGAPGAQDGSSSRSIYRGWRWEDLRLIRAFDGGPEEATFVLIHAEIEHHAPSLIEGYSRLTAPDALGPSGPFPAPTAERVASVSAGLAQVRDTLERIITSQLKMFNASDPRNYERYVRPWIFGWKGNADFPRGVVFEGVNGDAPSFLRGETGAQSTIVPSLDAVLGIAHRADVLRDMLQELEAYRPRPHREYLSHLREVMYAGADVGAGGAAMPASGGGGGHAEGAPRSAAGDGSGGGSSSSSSSSSSAGPPMPAHRLRDFVTTSRDFALVSLFNACVGLTWAFRDIHVSFADLYIARFTSKEIATGGTPFKAYLRKNRDEALTQQIDACGPAALCTWHIPSTQQHREEMEEVLRDDCVNGIPRHLLTRHAELIQKHGVGEPSLHRKAFPTAAQISNWQAPAGRK